MIPLVREIRADDLTPALAYLRCVPRGGAGFLIEGVSEGADGNTTVGRLSVVGFDPLETVRLRGGRVLVNERPIGKTIAALSKHLEQYRFPIGIPSARFTAGAVGYFGYDCVRYLERIPLQKDDGGSAFDECALLICGSYVIFDHAQGRARLVAVARGGGSGAYRTALARLERIARALKRPSPAERAKAPRRRGDAERVFKRAELSLSRAKFGQAIARLKQHIRAGDIFQGVLSERMSFELAADPFDVYRELRTLNPSPYLFFWSDGKHALVGASPEMLVKVEDGFVETCPIAGTRPRGRTHEEDQRFEKNLKASTKERAEHLMLVDLSRNDVGRVSRPGTVDVSEFMRVRRFSHVMHLISTVRGRLRAGLSPWEALLAAFPAGTLTGAPKVRAMQILSELEPVKRGPYGGAFVVQDFGGRLDSAITIRTLFCGPADRRGRRQAFAQAGAGVVLDSQAEREFQEIRSKARSVLQAVANAEEGR